MADGRFAKKLNEMGIGEDIKYVDRETARKDMSKIEDLMGGFMLRVSRGIVFVPRKAQQVFDFETEEYALYNFEKSDAQVLAAMFADETYREAGSFSVRRSTV